MAVFLSSVSIRLLFIVLIFAENQVIFATSKKNVEERSENMDNVTKPPSLPPTTPPTNTNTARSYTIIITNSNTTTDDITTSVPTTNSNITTNPPPTTNSVPTSETTESTTTTEPPCNSSRIPRELDVNHLTSNSFNLTWLEPNDTQGLIGYNLTIIRGNSSCVNHSWSDLPEQKSEVFTNETYLFFQNASAGFEYTVSVLAWFTTGSRCPASASMNFTTLPAVPKIENITLIEGLQTNVTLSINLTDDELVCYPLEIKVNCTASDEWECIIKEKNYTLQMKNSTNDFTLDGLSESTNYTCHFEIADSNSTRFTFQTTEYVPYFRNISTNIFKTEVDFSVTLTTENERLCPPRDLLVNCTSKDPWFWVINETTHQGHLVNLTYDFLLRNLSEFTNYTCNFEISGGISTNVEFQTAEDVPTSPENVSVSDITNSSFFLTWSEPSKIPTNLIGYNINITSRRKSNSTFPSNCHQTQGDIFENFTEDNSFHFKDGFPDLDYDITVWASSTAGSGEDTTISHCTLIAEPQLLNVSNRIEVNANNVTHYNVSGIIEFIPGCFNGEFDSYIINVDETRNHNDTHFSERIQDYQNTTYHISLRPEYEYVVNVTIKNAELITSKIITFTSPSGVPVFDDTVFEEIKTVSGTTEAKLALKRNYFSDTSGTLQYIAIIVSSGNISAGNFDEWKDDSKWPVPSSNETDIYYQATPKFWYPFKDTDNVDYSIGEDQSCSTGQQFCNAPLQPGKTYFVFIRIFNANYYRNTLPIIVITNPLSKLGLILGIIFGFSITAILGFIGFILWRKGILKKYFSKEESDAKVDLNINKFIEYCNYIENNPIELNKQWQELEEKSEEMYSDLSNYFSVLPENKRKNRFTNILPFDHSRVKLNIDEDDEICSDYINASYIKGFSNRHEYIATQGPLPHTVRDFWKMIFQENVSIIVMVAKFIENKREKCYKYFPNNHETILFGDDIEIRCSAELNFQIYCVRTLQVRKDVKQITVTHLQFLEWPDFGIPEGTDNLLHFCHQLRERWTNEGGMAVVHCSAGVGRTGTIVATDILIRAMQAEKKIDVFNTVLELRRQRKFMVQTEKQYLYIHQLLKSILEDPILEDDENQEHLYQNVELASEDKNGIVESAF